MRRSTIISIGLTLLAGFALLTPVSAGQISPWPTTPGFIWETQPFTPVCGTVSIVTPPTEGTLNMSGFTSGSKSTWLPYGGTYAERMCIAQLVLDSGSILDTVHARVYDPATSGRSGWAVILKDSTGRILDFGIRGFFASQQIIPHQYDSAAWTTTPVMTRTRTGNNYYTMDFDKQSDGTVKWTIDANENGTLWSSTGFTSVLYGDLTEVYLNVMTSDTTGAATYKWTEFGYTLVPEPSTALTLAWGLGALAVISRLRRR